MGRARRRLVTAMVVVASVLGFISVFALWAHRQALETETWTETSSELLEDPYVQDALAAFLVDALFSSVDVEAQLEAVLPEQAQVLAGPAAGGLRSLADRVAREALQRPRVQLLWEDANRLAHEALLVILAGGGEVVSTEEGVVELDAATLVEQVGAQVGVDVSGKVPEEVGSIEVLRSDELGLAQDVVATLRALAIGLTAATLALFALAVYLAKGWRREATRMVGIAFVVVGIGVLVARGLAGGYVVDSLASTAAVEPAVQSVWDIGTSLLEATGAGLIGYGVVFIAGAWLAGGGRFGSALRRELTPVLRKRSLAYALLAVILLLVFWWSPTPGTERLVPSLILIALAVAALEALRAQALRDFPDETSDRASERWRERVGGVRGWFRRDSAARSGAGEADSRLDEFERLAALRGSGALTEEEFEHEKALIRGSATSPDPHDEGG